MDHQSKVTKSSFVTLLASFSVVALLMLPGRAGADLLDRGPNMVYDDVLNITWTRDANLPGSSNLTWTQANSWAASLIVDGLSGWRLATLRSTSPSISIFNCDSGTAAACAAIGNELGYMFYHNLGGIFLQDKTGTQTSLLGGQTFTGIQQTYWSGTEMVSPFTAAAYVFSAGHPLGGLQTGQLSAWAVHPGDVAAVPEPETYAMMLTGLGLMGFVARRRKQKEAA